MEGLQTRSVLMESGLALFLMVLIKLIWLLADPTLRLYMGDSMVFMQAGAEFSGVGARSYPYGWTLYFVAFPFGSPWAILAWQAIWGSLTCLGLFLFLRHALQLTFVASLIPALGLATEPAQVFMERMVMAETLGLLAFVATLLSLSLYVARGGLGWYLLAVGAGLMAGALRTNFLPVVIGLGVLVPPLRIWAMTPTSGRRQQAKHLLAALSILVLCHLGYTLLYGKASGQPPGYMANTGMFRIGLVAPLVRQEHFEGTGVSSDVLEATKRPLDDHWQRGHHIWEEDGLWNQIRQRASDPEMVARTVTSRAMLSDPIRLLEINLETLGGYFDENTVHWRMLDDKGVIAPSEHDLSLIRQWLGWDARGISSMETPARQWFAASTIWLRLCLFGLVPLSVLALAMAWRSRGTRPQVMLLALASWGLFASHLLFAHIVSFRYLHAFPWFVLANMAVIFQMMFTWFRRSGIEARVSEGTPMS